MGRYRCQRIDQQLVAVITLGDEQNRQRTVRPEAHNQSFANRYAVLNFSPLDIADRYQLRVLCQIFGLVSREAFAKLGLPETQALRLSERRDYMIEQILAVTRNYHDYLLSFRIRFGSAQTTPSVDSNSCKKSAGPFPDFE